MSLFDEVIERRGTACLKYDFAVERGKPKDVLPFWVADMDFRTPPAVIEALVERSRHGIFGYTGIKEDYRKTVVAWLKNHHGYAPAQETLTVTPGVVFAICTAIRAFTEPGEAVLIMPPVYYPFANAVKDNLRRLVECPLVEKDGRYQMDLADMEQKIKKEQVKLLLLCSPHNPVGRVWRREELTQLAGLCLRHDVIVVADEIHADFLRPGHRHQVFAALSPEIAQNTVTCTSPSKTFNLAGLQVSNIFIENEKLRQKFRRTLRRTGYDEPNTLGLTAAKAAYDHGNEWLQELLAYLEENLRRTRVFLAKEMPLVRLIEPEGTYLLWLDFSRLGLTDEALNKLIVEQGRLWLDAGHIFGTGGENFQRINIACPWSVLEEGLKRLAQCLPNGK
ncbi:MAG: pyridoxal phosphate-dependent aminotransferase [Selenomonadaceae bacterium]|nr:pyridoxal phosphate-dependent aminotransferase [Selenomonadaceae bacterium]